MDNKELLSTYKNVFFRLNQTIYEWGKGFIITNDAVEEFEKDVDRLINLFDMVKLPEAMKVCKSSSTSAVRFYEGIYFHPMNFSGTIHKDNIKNYTSILSNFKSQYFSLDMVDVYDIREESLQYDIIKNNEEFEKITQK